MIQYYVASRVKTMEKPPVVSIVKECLQCHESVWVHVMMLNILIRCKGIICVDCVQELTNKSLGEIVNENAEHMMMVLDEEIKRLEKERGKNEKS